MRGSQRIQPVREREIIDKEFFGKNVKADYNQVNIDDMVMHFSSF